MVPSLFFSVLDGDAQVVEVCGHFRVVHIHNARTQNTHNPCCSGWPSAHLPPSRPSASPKSLPKQRPTTFAFSVVRLSSYVVVPHGSHLVLCYLPRQYSMMACLRLMSCPCRHLFVGTRTSNAHTDGNGSTDRPNSVLAFQQQNVPRPSVVRLWVCVTTFLCSGWLFSVFRRMATCSTMFFLTCQSIRTTDRLLKSSWIHPSAPGMSALEK